MTAAQLESILRAVAPLDLDGLQVYVGLETEVRFGMNPSPCGCWGVTGLGVDIDLRPHLGERWRGRGVGIVIADQHVRGIYPPDIASVELLGLALHELAHNLPWLPLARRCAAFAETPDDADADAHREKTRAFVQEMPPDDGDLGRRVAFAHHRFHTHGDTWLRAALHCWHRVRALGSDLPLPSVIDLQRSGVQRAVQAWHYNRAIGDEPARLSACSFAEILEKPLPSQFRELWEMDCNAFADSMREEIMTTPVEKKLAGASGEQREVYWTPIAPDVLKRRQELAAIITEDAAAEGERERPVSSTLRRVELSILKAKAKAARRELLKTAPDRFQERRAHLMQQLEALDKRIKNQTHNLERTEINVQRFQEHAEKAAGERGFNIGKTVREIESWAGKYLEEAKSAAARADQRRIDLADSKAERETVRRELVAVEKKMLQADPK
ncbi:MAG: hypothetical protein L0Y71_26070 [Gemmataceae bacterium]|nr:hypothetical protein [Gemmataceae bacterium]